MKKINLLDWTFTDEPIPYEINGFPNDLMADLSWLGSSYPQYQNVGWWPEQYNFVELSEYENITGYTWELDKVNKIVIGTPIVVPWTPEAIAEDKAIKLQAFIDNTVVIVQARLDAFAKSKKYDSILSACTYAIGADPEFSVEGKRAVYLREATWRKLYDTLAAVNAGTVPMPASIDDINLPALTWEEV